MRSSRVGWMMLAGMLCTAGLARARVEITPRTGIWVPAAEPGFVKLAARDLAGDIGKITGRTPPIVSSRASCGAPCLVIASVEHSAGTLPQAVTAALRGKWEATRVMEIPGGVLMAGSDSRGAMFAVYDFIERFLGVDPLYYWTGREPAKRARLAWESVALENGEPAFRYRGWFVNDEDLLTEWRDGGGTRELEYPYYHQVTAPSVLARVFEAAVRLRMNLIIPASFTDIDNPAERRMIEDATARGLYVSMHHVEPMGVSAFAFARYWKAQGKSVPFSFFTQREAFESTWRHYASEWAKFPGVVWQLGLRGIADRPVWVSDPHAPKTDEERGKMISDAMALQRNIIGAVDRRPHPPITTTLWMEGAGLNRKGHLRFPNDVAVIFADNSPGWKMDTDFFETAREAGRNYGIYYHHALWGSGPHLAQGVAPWRTHAIFREAVMRGDKWYAIVNVANVREFALGLDASARMLRDFAGFDPNRYFARWCTVRFGAAAAPAEKAYREFFDSYVVDPKRGTPELLDGLTVHAGNRMLTALEAGKPVANAARTVASAALQRKALEAAGASATAAMARMDESGRAFFEVNLVAQQKIMLGLTKWLEAIAQAAQATERARVAAALRDADAAFAEVRAGQALAARGEFRDWYRGDRKMNLEAAGQLTRKVLARYRENEKP